MKKQKYPPGWNEERVRQVIAHYDNQTEEEQAAEIEAARTAEDQTMMSVPSELVPKIARLIVQHQERRSASNSRTQGPPKAKARSKTAPRTISASR